MSLQIVTFVFTTRDGVGMDDDRGRREGWGWGYSSKTHPRSQRDAQHLGEEFGSGTQHDLVSV